MTVFQSVPGLELVTFIERADQVTDLMQRNLTRAEALATVRDTETWGLTPASVTGMDQRIDAYDAAVAHESWRARVMSDAGETAAGMIVAGTVTVITCCVIAWLGAYLQAVA